MFVVLVGGCKDDDPDDDTLPRLGTLMESRLVCRTGYVRLTGSVSGGTGPAVVVAPVSVGFPELAVSE